MAADHYCSHCGADVARWGHDDGCKRPHDPIVKGKGDDCWVVCRECGFVGSDRPDDYTPGVLKLSTSRANANNIARKHRTSERVPA